MMIVTNFLMANYTIFSLFVLIFRLACPRFRPFCILLLHMLSIALNIPSNDLGSWDKVMLLWVSSRRGHACHLKRSNSIGPRLTGRASHSLFFSSLIVLSANCRSLNLGPVFQVWQGRMILAKCVVAILISNAQNECRSRGSS